MVKVWQRWLLALTFCMGIAGYARAADVTPIAYDLAAPDYTGTVFTKMTAALIDGALYFGAIAVMCILVTGFFVGRRWFRRAA